MKRMSWVNFSLGLWLVMAGLASRPGSVVVEDITAGLFIAFAALWASQAFDVAVSAAASWTVAIVGAWVTIAPFALRYHGSRLPVANDVLVGLTVVALGGANVRLKFRRMTSRDHRARLTSV
jgi:hypothetical protein